MYTKRIATFAGLVLAMASIHFMACDKDSSPSTTIRYTLDQIPMVENRQNTQDLLKLVQDADDEKIMGFCYEMGLATRELIKDPEFNQTMIDLAQKNPISVVYLIDLKQDAPAYFQAINENLAKKNLSLEYIAQNMTHKPVLPHPEHPETAKMEHYEPAIFIPNLENADPAKQPLLSPNLAADGDKAPELDDFIVTWYYTESGGLKEIMLGETTASKTTNPVFIMDNAQRFEQGAVVLGGKKQFDALNVPNSSEDRAIIRFDSRELKIQNGYRYETVGASEYAIIGVRIQNNPIGNGLTHIPYGVSSKVIVDIASNQIGNTVNAPSLHANVWLPYADNPFFWNTYERDWSYSPKNLGTATFDGTPVWFAGERKYESEWYAWLPSTLQDHATPFDWFGWETSVNFYSWKADYVVHRVE